MDNIVIPVLMKSDEKEEIYRITVMSEEYQKITNGGKCLFIMGESFLTI